MKRTLSFLVYLLPILVGVDTALAVEPLRVTPEERRQIGVETELPQAVTEVSVVSVLARVVLPPNSDTALSAPLSGMLVQFGAAIGDQVMAGQVLAELQSAEFLRLQREFLAADSAEVFASSQRTRDLALFDDGIIAKRRLEETLATAQTATARLREARQLLLFSGMNDLEIEKLRARKKSQQRLALRAPADGTVVERFLSAGARVETSDPLFRVADLSTLWLELQVPQEQSLVVSAGMRIALVGHADATAVVASVGQAVDPQTQAVVVRGSITTSDGRLKPGQTVSATILSRTQTAGQAVWSVPVGAVIRRGEIAYVFAQSATGFDVRRVSVISSDRRRAYISSGVEADTQVVFTGVSVLKALWATVEDSAT